MVATGRVADCETLIYMIFRFQVPQIGFHYVSMWVWQQRCALDTTVHADVTEFNTRPGWPS